MVSVLPRRLVAGVYVTGYKVLPGFWVQLHSLPQTKLMPMRGLEAHVLNPGLNSLEDHHPQCECYCSGATDRYFTTTMTNVTLSIEVLTPKSRSKQMAG